MRKGILSGTMAGIFVMMTVGGANAGWLSSPWIDYREWQQEQRISRGAASGSLIPREALALAREQARIRWMENEMKADGRLTGRERLRLLRAQNEASLNIWRLKHNGYER